MKVFTDAIGHNISTKKVGEDERHDVTLNYKYENMSDMDKLVRKSIKTLESSEFVHHDIKIDLVNGKDHIVAGEPFEFKVTVDTQNIKKLNNAHIKCRFIDYRAKPIEHFYNQKVEFKAAPNTHFSHAVVSIPYSSMSKMMSPDLPSAVVDVFVNYDDSLVQLESNQFEVENSSLLEIDSPSIFAVNKQQMVTVTFKNNLLDELKDIKIHLYQGFESEHIFKILT